MATIELKKKELIIPEGRSVKVIDVLREARNNHNELVDAISAVNAYLRDISLKLDKIPNIETAIEFNADSFKSVTDNLMPALQLKVDKNLDNVKKELLVAVHGNTNKLINLESHGRRKNVIINGIPSVESEDVEVITRAFLKDTLELDEQLVHNMLFRDCHRLPKPKAKDGREFEKPIILACVSQKDRNVIMRNAFNLKDTGISIKSDLPKPLNDLRNMMLKERHRLKMENPHIKYRVSEVRYLPVLQRSNGKKPNSDYIKWEDIDFKG